MFSNVMYNNKRNFCPKMHQLFNDHTVSLTSTINETLHYCVYAKKPSEVMTDYGQANASRENSGKAY